MVPARQNIIILICYCGFVGLRRRYIIYSPYLLISQQPSLPRLPDLALVKSCRPKDAVHLTFQLLHFPINICSVFFRVRAVGRLHCQLVYALQHILHFVQRTLCRLDIAHPFRNVVHSLVEAPNLSSHLLRNRQSGRIVRRPVDPIT